MNLEDFEEQCLLKIVETQDLQPSPFNSWVVECRSFAREQLLANQILSWPNLRWTHEFFFK